MSNHITDNLDLWTNALEMKSGTGRGSSKKLNLYGIKKLRELILELAVRGKLIPQDESDEPASVLLERIAEEKAILIKEKKIKKGEVLPEIGEDEKPFELPLGWEYGFISQVVANDKYAIKRGPFGSSLKKAFFVKSGYKVYEQQHAIRDDFSLGEYYIDDKKFEELSAFEVKPNDVIISCSGTVGKIAIAPENMERGVINQALLKLTLNENVLLNDYFKILFPAFYMRTDTLNDLKGTAQKNMVSVDTLKKEPFPLPPLPEQKRIVAKVDELMALCDQLESQTESSIAAHELLVETLLNTLTESSDSRELTENWNRISAHFETLFTTESSIEKLKQTVLQLAVMGKLVEQDASDEPASVLLEKIAEHMLLRVKNKEIKKPKKVDVDFTPQIAVPDNWDFKLLNDLAFVTKLAGFEYSKYINLEDNGEIPVIRAQNVRPFKPDLTNLKYIDEQTSVDLPRSALDRPSLLVTFIGAGIGDVCVFNEKQRWHLAPNVAKLEPFSELNLDYLCIYLNSPAGKKELFKSMKSTAQPSISMTTIREIWIPIPPLAEQHRIVSKVNQLTTLCDQLKARITESKTIQKHFADAVVQSVVG